MKRSCAHQRLRIFSSSSVYVREVLVAQHLGALKRSTSRGVVVRLAAGIVVAAVVRRRRRRSPA
jgi:hypothetical protein